ncbi:myosin regulatory light chain, invertebrate [Tremella mesenterica]|uniref:Myosin regulatory light chain, invertebrate n=1 Tax=Tremella mesenterica TaxID=5217 RepID=A0A4Q1BSZ5_TREME|nr:uncharacterized protein TREMEDRAFT_33743 [Tremella mesenterica DSM 1558]EIW67268.1 hypothetical protein TREMEDRAFT_33743 [Tremella mesenterica DSM 1558]RXK41171.1 myosin regulatory light chain, invertebrate [Tremella mesenterica]
MQSSKPSSLGVGFPSTKKPNQTAHPREPSGGAYTMFTPQQVKQFKEAFNMIDQDGDGRVTEGDLRVMLANLGQTPTPTLLNNLLSSRPGNANSGQNKEGINFTQFLSMMGERLLALDPEPELLEAFASFDEGDKGVVDVKEMRRWLGEMGDRMEDWEIDRLFSGPFTRGGKFDYVEFAKVLRVNDGEEERDDKLAT